MDDVRIVDAGDQLVVTGADRDAVQAALDDLSRRGARILSAITPVGSKFTATATHPDTPHPAATAVGVPASSPEAGGPPDWKAELEQVAARYGVSISDAGTHLILTGDDKASLDLALAALAPTGLELTSAVAPIGTRWIASCQHPEHVRAPCTIETLGLKTVVSGRYLVAVQAKIDELERSGGTVIAPPELTGGVWTAIVDLGERQEGMRFR